MDKEYILGIDLGTSACKLAIFHYEEGLRASVTKAYPTTFPKSGWAQQSPSDWWRAVREGLSELLETSGVSARDIAVVGVDGQSWGPVFLDKDGNILYDTPIWMDTRAWQLCEAYTEEEKRRIFEVSGNPLQPSYATLKVEWLRQQEPLAYRELSTLLLSSNYIVYRLSGRYTLDVSQGYGWHFFNIRTKAYDPELAERFGVLQKMLPPVFECQDIVGTVTEKAAQETGLLQGTPVIAGGLDAACANLGTGVMHDGECQEQGGQAGGISICSSSCNASENLILSFHVVPDKWLLQGGTVGGGGVLKWVARTIGDYEQRLAREGKSSAYDLLTELAGDVDPGSAGLIFLPYMSGERTPIWNPKAKGLWYGLDYAKTKGHLIRAAMEGVAYSVRHNIEAAEKAGCRVGDIRATGGSANSELWTQMKADVSGKTFSVCNSDDTTVLGTAILAGVGVGLYHDYEEAVKKLIQVKRIHEPQPANRLCYDAGYQKYLELYQCLKHLMV